ncbi:MAG TPA: NADH-quinone oxidoreductase subunit G [Actinomycetota bacterium]|nr:NADH-quinone oxidoreductase subunit G [Actinomycetota bacterium]
MSPDAVTVSIDGTPLTVPAGTLIIRAAEELGIEIPRFCDHPLLAPVAACRQCFVEVEGQRKLLTACSTPVADGMAIHTQFSSDQARAAQESVLEFLLINHPLDCPVCDRGGECPLQDQALAFGPGESRYVEAKRTYRKPLPLSPLVYLDRERCVLCQRCTRFCDQISGDRFIEVLDRGASEQIGIAAGEDFASPFSGNTIQICPVGALTASTYRFAARPFDVVAGESVCAHCSAGCNLTVQLRGGRVVRTLARDNLDVNEAWLCDKGRFAFAHVDTDRLTTPLLRDPGLEPVSFDEAFGAIAARLPAGARAAFLVGGRLCDEDAYAVSKFARVVCETNDVDHRIGGAGDVPIAVEAAQAVGTTATYADVDRAKVVLIVGLDVEQEVPILHLRIRKAARAGARVFVIHPRRTRLYDVAEHVVCAPGEEAHVLSSFWGAPKGSDVARLAEALREADGNAVVLAGARLADSPGAVARAEEVAAEAEASFALVPRRAGDRGALRAGLHPGLLPGGRPVADADARARVEVAWGRLLPGEPGRDALGILSAAANREIDVLFVIGCDPLRDAPDAALARRALENAPFRVVVDTVEAGMAPFANLLLPAAASIERDGRLTDWEGRSQELRGIRPAPGVALPDWEIFSGLARAMGLELGFGSLDELRREMATVTAGDSAETTSEGPAPARARERARDAGGVEAAGTGDGLVLFTYPLLVDEGRQVAEADTLKLALEEPAFVELHPADAGRLGVGDGAPVRLRTGAGEAVVPARVTPHVAEGAAFVPWNQPGLAANTLLSGSRTTTVTVELVGAPEAVRAAGGNP